MAEPDVVISVRDVHKTFRDEEGNEAHVLSGVGFDVYRGETLVIMGGSGCGKSTLLNCMIGELEVDRGAILYRTRNMPEARDLVGLPEGELNEIRKRFGILFQSGALFSSLTVAENVALPLVEHSQVDPEVIEYVVGMKLRRVKLMAHRDKLPAQLSGGQRKRAGLARATALDPEILFYDEPSAGLDPVTSTAIDGLIADLSRKLFVTSVVVTHEMDSAFRIADRMIMLDKGRVLRVGTKEEFAVLRDAPGESLRDADEQLIHQFLNGLGAGPLTDAEGISEFEKLIGLR